MIRVDNLADNVSSDNTTAQYIDMQGLSGSLYSKMNADATLTSFTVEEYSLTGNQLMSNMTANKIAWNTTDSTTEPTIPTDTDTSFAFQPQRIRVFKVTYQ